MIACTPSSIEVVAGVIRRGDGRILISLRPGHLDQGGLWEFPGGKRELGEARFVALARELKEELDIQIASATPLLRLRHDYPGKIVNLDVWDVSTWEGQEKGVEGQRIRWVSPRQLHRYKFPAANKTVITAARLPRVIVAIPLSNDNGGKSLGLLEICLQSGVRCVLLSSTQRGAVSAPGLADRLSALCRRFEAQLIVASTSDVAARLGGGAGLHLPGGVLGASSKRPPGRGHVVSALCTNARELEHAERIGVDMVLIAPVYADRGYPDTAPLGWSKLEHLVSGTPLPAYAAGGLRPADLARSVAAGCQGVVMPGELWSREPRSVIDALDRALFEVQVTGV